MPVPKKKQKVYGVIVGAMRNKGKSLEEAKDIADRAVKHKEVVKSAEKTLRKKSKKTVQQRGSKAQY